MKNLVKWMNILTSFAFWLMVIMIPLMVVLALISSARGGMNRQTGAEFMLLAGGCIGGAMFLFLILKIITGIVESLVNKKTDNPIEEEVEPPKEA